MVKVLVFDHIRNLKILIENLRGLLESKFSCFTKYETQKFDKKSSKFVAIKSFELTVCKRLKSYI